MKLINNKILINLKNSKNEYLLVNLLFGLVDVLTEAEANIIKKWEKEDDIVPSNEYESELFDALNLRFYFLSGTEENNLRKEIIQKNTISLQKKLTHSKSASFIFSYACNFSCPYCYESNRNCEYEIMKPEMVDAVLNLYTEGINHIGFFGGEPLLPQNETLIRYIICKVPNAYYTIITNGYYLDYFLPILKKIRIAIIQVTLDGKKEQHNETRILKNGKPTYDKIISNIQLCIENGIHVKIRMNLSKENFNNCFEARKELINMLDTEYVSIEMQPLFKYSYKEQTNFIKNMLQEDNTANLQNRIWKTLPPLSNFIFNKKQFKPLIKFCESENQNRFYDCYGNIYSCILSVGERNKSIGTYYPELKLNENSMLAYDITKNPTCNECNLALICGGGCPYYIMNDSGEIKGTNCYNIKNEIENLIPMLYKQIYGD